MSIDLSIAVKLQMSQTVVVFRLLVPRHSDSFQNDTHAKAEYSSKPYCESQ